MTPPEEYRPSALIGWLYSASIIVALYLSLKVILEWMRIDADTSLPLILWHGVHTHGLAWLKDFVFTPDNWLFSIIPVDFLGFTLLGAKPAVVLLSGWLIFISAAFISGVIAWQLNAKRASFGIPLALLSAGFYAHRCGFVSYPVSHNVTNLFGLVTVSLLLRWMQWQKNRSLFLMLALLAAGAVSDPWMVAAYSLPIILLSMLLLLSSPKTMDRAACVKLFLISVVALAAVPSGFFGLLNFIPSLRQPFHFPRNHDSWKLLWDNSIFLIKDLGGLLNIVPLHHANYFDFGLVSIGAIGMLFVINIAEAGWKNILASKTRFVFFLFSPISIGGTSLAFLMGLPFVGGHASDDSARFVLNGLYLIVIGLGVLMDLNWEKSTRMRRIFDMAVVGLFLIAGNVSTAWWWTKPGLTFANKDTENLIKFLRRYHLSYGYGVYWGSRANAVTGVSDSEIRIRPVRFDERSGRMFIGDRNQVSRRWYRPEDIPYGQKEYFVAVGHDGEECADVGRCMRGLREQFGSPAKILRYNSFYPPLLILVWDHPLLGYQRPLGIQVAKLKE